RSRLRHGAGLVAHGRRDLHDLHLPGRERLGLFSWRARSLHPWISAFDVYSFVFHSAVGLGGRPETQTADASRLLSGAISKHLSFGTRRVGGRNFNAPLCPASTHWLGDHRRSCKLRCDSSNSGHDYRLRDRSGVRVREWRAWRCMGERDERPAAAVRRLVHRNRDSLYLLRRYWPDVRRRGPGKAATPADAWSDKEFGARLVRDERPSNLARLLHVAAKLRGCLHCPQRQHPSAKRSADATLQHHHAADDLRRSYCASGCAGTEQRRSFSTDISK